MGGVYTYSRYFFHDEKYRQEENKHTSGTGQTKKGMWKEIIQSGSVYRSVCVCIRRSDKNNNNNYLMPRSLHRLNTASKLTVT